MEIDTGGKLATESNAEHVSFKDKHIILVDDCIQSGETIRLAKKTLLEAGAQEVLTGVLTLKKDKSKGANSYYCTNVNFVDLHLEIESATFVIKTAVHLA